MKNIILILLLVHISQIAFVQEKSCSLYQIPPKHLGNNSIEEISEQWALSGANIFPISIPPERQIDVSDPKYKILPNMQPVGQKINDLITSQNSSSINPIMLYFPPGAYLIDKSLILDGGVILKGAGGDEQLPSQTHFHFDLSENYAHPCISITDELNGVEDIYVIDETKCQISIIKTPSGISSQFPVLNYTVINASSMDVTIIGACSGYGTVTGDKGKFKCPDIEPGTYTVTAVFSNPFDSKSVTHELKVYSKKEKKKNDKELSISSTDQIGFENDSIKASNIENFYQNTISISGNNNFIRGVESYNTRKYHVYINGNAHHNTISGCYFHHSVDYSDNNGKGYGVCLGGFSKKNRIEDNFFRYLRHSILLQGDTKKNVVAYNYSREVHAFNGGFSYDADDLCFHGRTSTSIGPTLNLLEGNIVIRSRIDKTHDFNGPYNTFFRNRAIDFFKIKNNIFWDESYRKKQYAQNVIGCNMKPKGNTLKRLKKYGYKDYYPEITELPSYYCSFYLNSEPDFFLGWIQWPYTPWDNKIIPAKYRWDSHQGYYDPVPYAIKQGWDDYSELCGPPNYHFKNKTFANVSEEYSAMNMVTFKNVSITNNSSVNFLAKNEVLLKPGTLITKGNHVLIKAGNICDTKFGSSSKYDVYSYNKPLHYVKHNKSDTVKNNINSASEESDQISIFPNPNYGHFEIKFKLPISKNSIKIFGIMGNELQYHISETDSGFSIHLTNNYKGIVLVKLSSNDNFFIKKIIIR